MRNGAHRMATQSRKSPPRDLKQTCIGHFLLTRQPQDYPSHARGGNLSRVGQPQYRGSRRRPAKRRILRANSLAYVDKAFSDWAWEQTAHDPDGLKLLDIVKNFGYDPRLPRVCARIRSRGCLQEVKDQIIFIGSFCWITELYHTILIIFTPISVHHI